MRRRQSAILSFAGLLLAATTLGGQAPSLTGVVQRVIDGDTIVVSSGVGTVRLIGVDTPETVDPRKPVQYFGREATAFTKRMAEGQSVRLEFEGTRKDKYNRTLAYVYLADGTLLNAELIRQGYAHAYTQFPFSKMDEFRALQRDAMEDGRGLWAADVEPAAQSTRSPALDVPTRAGTSNAATNATETVYATRTGAKYHRAGCRYLARSQIPLSLSAAAGKFGPCRVCRPPVLHEAISGPTVLPRVAPATTKPAATSSRCQAITKRGMQCSRRAQPGRNYCWQH